MTRIYNFKVSSSYTFYLDNKGEQKFTREKTYCTVGRITFWNRVAMVIDYIQLVWSHK